MVLTGNGLYQLPCAVYWWGCCLSSSPVVGKQWHFASSALQVRGKSNQCATLSAPRCEHQLPCGNPLTTSDPLQPLPCSLFSALSYLTPHPAALPLPQHRPCASPWKEAPLFPAGCTSLLQLLLYQALVSVVLEPKYAERTVPFYREKYGNLWGEN